ncbi:MAG: permease [Phycisphaerae bacterium]|nr:MAG: permease [Planctomycetota bacterium]KAB2939908.1 MAG: permease [Phycisphaerae bacterium]MBE7455133.1 permease [Planctomycetia bacterium]MCL4720223.1 permease [Phycisphaerae bacterium]MCQ3922534.1 permease [Planctomycetota bacterium]
MFAREGKIAVAFVAVFLTAYTLPLADPKVSVAIVEAFKLLQWYARNHTLACVVPALFIAGGIITFLSPDAVMRYLGPKSNKFGAYTVASVAGVVLAVCSCSVLPMFAGIYQLGAGLGPASAFLYSGPAINILAIFLTARVLGFDLGLWRALGAIGFAFLVGLGMAWMFRKEEQAKVEAAMQTPDPPPARRRGWQSALLLASMIGFLVFSDWFNPGDAIVKRTDGSEVRGVVLQEMHDEVMIQVQESVGTIRAGERLTLPKSEIAAIVEAKSWVMDVFHMRWLLAGACGLAVALMTWRWVERDEFKLWMHNTWGFAKLLIPLLFGGVFVVGFISALLPDRQIAALVGDNGLRANVIASLVGALFYFATLTEVPIVQALMEHGMARGPALALLLAGPALSLPNMLVLVKVMGVKKTLAFSAIIVVVATGAGMIYGATLPAAAGSIAPTGVSP